MNIKLLTVSSHTDVPGLHTLVRSLIKFNWPHEVIQAPWHGFSTKILATRDYLLQHPEITHFFFADAYDVVALADMAEAMEKIGDRDMLWSSEKGCWPDPALAEYYPEIDSPFKYLNSGLFFANRDKCLTMVEDMGLPEYGVDDQLFYTYKFLSQDWGMELDTAQEVFNSHSFIAEGEYTYENGRVQIMGNEPIFIHSNGKTPDPQLDEMVRRVLE